ncbi:MAG TPA: Maf family nucleotide pyrophosphatase [Parvularculaceae bacterium]|nr:Maf family nucleotide pyrophosphatase [Parvularculaceae bacterium]
MAAPVRLVLASASPRRLDLLRQIGVEPDAVIAANVDESVLPRELAPHYAERVARAKAAAIREEGALVLAADTAVACGRRILPKAEDEATARACLTLLSGRSHRVFSAIVLAGPGEEMRSRVVESRVKVARLEARDIDAYVASQEWRGKAGGYAIQGLFAKHVVSIIGSYSNIVGLPLYETANLLKGAGWRTM